MTLSLMSTLAFSLLCKLLNGVPLKTFKEKRGILFLPIRVQKKKKIKEEERKKKSGIGWLF